MKTGVTYSVIWLFALFCYTKARFRCDYTYSAAGKGWYKYVAIPATWDDARLRCTSEGATLASPTKFEIEMRMKEIINDSSSKSEVFTGIFSTFSRGNYYAIEEGTPLNKISFTWAKGEPTGKNESCITFNENGELADRSCDEYRPYICYRSSDKTSVVNACGTVDPEYKLDQTTNSCYKMHTVVRTFERAHFVCSAEGGHLAIIDSEAEVAALKNVFAQYPTSTFIQNRDYAFIGIHQWGQLEEWRTIFGQPLSEAVMKRFDNKKLDYSTPCALFTRSSDYIIPYTCNGQLAPFICEKDPKYPALCEQSLDESEYF